MTDLSHYRVGPTKTRDGRDAVIYAIYPDQRWPIHGAIKDDYGSWAVESSRPSDGVYLPNNLPTTVTRWLPPDGSLQVSDTEREGWTPVEVPVQPVRGSVAATGHCDPNGDWIFSPINVKDTHLLTLPTENSNLVCGDYRDAAGNMIKVERIK